VLSSTPSVALLTSVAALAVTLAACGSEEATSRPAQTGGNETSPSSDLPPGAESTTKAEPACVPRGDGHARICALAPPHRIAEKGTAYKVTTISGESFWVVLPDELAPSSGVVVVPGVPIRVNAGLTTASAREAADRYCDDFPKCEPIAVNREAVPVGLLTRWDDASGTIKDFEVTTVDLGPWTLVMLEPDAALAERVARALSWSVDEDGYPRLASTDPDVPVDVDWADVVLWVPNLEEQGKYHLIEVIPGCDLSAKEPDLGGSDAGPDLELHEPDTVEGGRWCVDGRYWVDVAFVERPRLELFTKSSGSFRLPARCGF
jgi:hypothetical protein